MTTDAIRPGEEFNGLEVLRELGRSPRGEIFLARDPLIGRQVTLKTIYLPSDGEREAEGRLLALVRRVGGLTHPNISHLHRIHPLPGGHGFALELEFLEGTALRERLQDQAAPIDTAEVVSITRSMLSALAAAHRRGVVHGQLDEEKVILGRGGLVKLVDFGIAVALTDSASHESHAEDLRSAARLVRLMLEREGPEQEGPLRSELEQLAGEWQQTDGSTDLSGALEALEGIGRRCGAAWTPQTTLGLRTTRLIGRREELERIETALVETLRGRAGALLIEGGPGAGKSSLLREAAAIARAAGVTHLELDLSGQRGIAQALFEAAGSIGLPPLAGGDGWEPASDCAPLVRALLSEPERVAESAPYTTFRACEGLLAELCARRPLLLVLDGVHRVPAEDARLLAELIGKRTLSRMLVLAAADSGVEEGARLTRSPGAVALAAAPHVALLELSPLDAGAIHRLIEERAGGFPPSAELVQHVVEVCEGNPLLAQELFDHLERAGAIERREGLLRISRAWDEIPPPPRCEELFRVPLGRLSEDQREILQVAAVDGIEFDGQAVAAALGRPSIGILRALQAIWRKGGLLQTRADGYRFVHGLLREWIYRSLPAATRSAHHRAIAEHLEDRPGATPPDPARLARHWEEAKEPGRARPHFLAAAQAAIQRRDPHRAIDHAQRAGWEPGAIPTEEAAQHLPLIRCLARAHWTCGHPEVAHQLLGDLERAANAAHDEALLRRARLDRARLRFEIEGPGSVDEADLIALRNAEPEGALRAGACHLLGRAAKHSGRFAEAERWLEEASSLQEDADERSSLALSIDQLASVAARNGRLRDACRLYRRGAELCRASGLDAEAALHELNESRCARDSGAATDLTAAFEKCLRLLSLAGQRHRHAQVTVTFAEHLLDRGERETAVALIERSVPVLEAASHLPGLQLARRILGRIALTDGDLDQAGDQIATAIQLAARSGDLSAGAETHALEAQRLCLLGRAEEATAAAEASLRRTQAAADWRARGRVLESLAEALFLGLPPAAFLEAQAWPAGDAGGALIRETACLLRGALAWATEDGSIHDLREGAEAYGDEGRPLRKLLSEWMTAEAKRRSGDRPGARAHAERARRQATLLRHVWLEADLARYLDELG